MRMAPSPDSGLRHVLICSFSRLLRQTTPPLPFSPVVCIMKPEGAEGTYLTYLSNLDETSQFSGIVWDVYGGCC